MTVCDDDFKYHDALSSLGAVPTGNYRLMEVMRSRGRDSGQVLLALHFGIKRHKKRAFADRFLVHWAKEMPCN